MIIKHYGSPHLFGYSLGSSVAAYAASKLPAKRVYLVGAFCSVASLAKYRFGFIPPLLRYRFSTCDYLKGCHGGVCLFSSKDDNLVAYASVLELIDSAKDTLECVEVYSGLNHVELLWEESLHRKIKALCYSSSISKPSQNSS